MMKKKSLKFALLLASLAATQALAQDGTLIEKQTVRITPVDVKADAQRLRPDARQTAMSAAGNVRQVAQNLYVRRALAAEAKKEGVEQDPLVQALVQQAVDRVLSDAYLVKLDERNEPDAKAVEAYAQTKYKGEPQRFQAPPEARARHLLIRGSSTDAKERAEKLLQQIKAGGNFEALAKEYSEDPASAVKGGDLGYFGKGRMVKPFEEAVDALKNPGEVSGLVETQFGFHIVQLVDRREAGVRPYDEVKEVLHREARSVLLSEGRVNKAQELLDGAKFNDEAIKAVADSFKQP